MISEAEDFAAEVHELYALLKGRSPSTWGLRTQFQDWSIKDVILHLYSSDVLCAASLASESNYRALKADINERRCDGLSMIEESRERYPELAGDTLFKLWYVQANAVADALKLCDPVQRLAWSGPSMSARMMAIARQMETWAHSQEIYDCLGLHRPTSERLVNIVEIGVKTYRWTFKNRALDPPVPMPRVELTAPDGKIWRWNADGETTDRVVGLALEFCQVVTQVRNIADTRLHVYGYAANEWMKMAQCFAGPPSDPPEVGVRFCQVKENSENQ